MDGAQGITIDPKMTAETLTKTTEKLTSFSQGNAAAIMESGQVWAAGCQAISMGIMATVQYQFDQTMTAWKALAGARSLKEVMDLRASLPLVSFEKAFCETGKITDASLKLAGEMMAPITARITVAALELKSTIN